MIKISKIDEDWKEEKSSRGGSWRYRDLSGEQIGARIEELSPGATSSEHHFHTTEEEHVIVLEGSATLILGDNRHQLESGEHVWFKAGEEVPHHIKNTSDSIFKFLVFGERKTNDVVVYPEHKVMMLKSLGFQQFTYRPLKKD